MNFLELCKSRRSTRFFSRAEVSSETLETILEAGIWAPSGHNEQPWFFSVVRDKSLQDTISVKTKEMMKESPVSWIVRKGADPDFHLFYHAPAVIVVSGKASAYSALVDCSAATQNMLLMAHAQGLGGCWIGLISPFLKLPEAKELLGIPEDYQGFYAIALGYPEPGVVPKAPPRKPPQVQWL